MKQYVVYLLLAVIAILIIPYIGTTYLNDLFSSDISGWLQAGIAIISFPVILYQLSQIRQSINRQPELRVGLIGIDELPLSDVRKKKNLEEQITISRGYAHFFIVVKNIGEVPARYLKIYLEHERDESYFPMPLVKVSEFSENKPSFFHEHNFAFVFRSGTDWIINSEDIEVFGFHVTTTIMKKEINASGEEIERFQYPPPCEIKLNCTIWAEQLDTPIQKDFRVNIVGFSK